MQADKLIAAVVTLAIISQCAVAETAILNPKRIMIVNMAGVEDRVLEQVRGHAETNMYVTVVATNVTSVKGDDLMSIGEGAVRLKTPSDACLIVLASPSRRTTMHALMLTNVMVTVVNADAMHTDVVAKYASRLQRQVIRGTAFLFGIGGDPDPFCVMHDYRTLEDLDKMGMNFSPPWGEMFRKAAAARGLEVRPLFKPRPPKAPPAK